MTTPTDAERVREFFKPILDDALGPVLDTYRAVRETVDDLSLDDAAVGRKVRQIMADAAR